MTDRHRRDADRLVARLEAAMKDLLTERRQRAAALVGTLDALSPLGVLSRGYARVRKEGRLVRSAVQAVPGEAVEVELADGALHCEVKEVEWRSRPAPDGSRAVRYHLGADAPRILREGDASGPPEPLHR
jgi:exonuclease VII large subunit